MLMKKCFIALASLLLLLSCEKSEDQSEYPVKEYELVDITFAPTKEDGIQKADIEFEGAYASNPSATSISLPFVIEKEVDDEQSAFTMSQALPKEIASRNDIYVDVPDIMGSRFIKRVAFSEVSQSDKRVFKCTDEVMELPRFTEYLITCRIRGYKQVNEFTATFKEVHSGEIFKIKGEWRGVKYSGVETRGELSYLK